MHNKDKTVYANSMWLRPSDDDVAVIHSYADMNSISN